MDCFGSDFIQWKLDIPNYGVVLEMGMLGSVRGTKIYLGVSTNLRNTKYLSRIYFLLEVFGQVKILKD